MFFDEDDIDFSKLSDSRFEELCFDLLSNTGYHSLVWRQGGADSGRDIEAHFSLANPLIGNYSEKWFVECKRYSGGVPVDEISSKLAWADADKPQHLLIITSSYLSNSTRTWLEKMREGKAYYIHLLEGKQLRKLLLKHQHTIEKYFLEGIYKILLDSIRTWLAYEILPDIETIYLILKDIEYSKLTTQEFVFLWIAYTCKCHSQECYSQVFFHPQRNKILSLIDNLFKLILNKANYDANILNNENLEAVISLEEYRSPFDEINTRERIFFASVVIKELEIRKTAFYCFFSSGEEAGLEILIEKKQEELQFLTKIRPILQNITSEGNDIIRFLKERKRIMITMEHEDGIFIAKCPYILGCIGQGKTEQEALTNIQRVLGNFGKLKAQQPMDNS
jgi:predicted RNase H-like HicB family nuclease